MAHRPHGRPALHHHARPAGITVTARNQASAQTAAPECGARGRARRLRRARVRRGAMGAGCLPSIGNVLSARKTLAVVDLDGFARILLAATWAFRMPYLEPYHAGFRRIAWRLRHPQQLRGALGGRFGQRMGQLLQLDRVGEQKLALFPLLEIALAPLAMRDFPQIGEPQYAHHHGPGDMRGEQGITPSPDIGTGVGRHRSAELRMANRGIEKVAETYTRADKTPAREQDDEGCILIGQPRDTGGQGDQRHD